MLQKVEFPEYLSSMKGEEPSEPITLQFQNYFPLSSALKEESQMVPISTDCETIEKQTRERMAQFNLDSLYEEGKINIYPKKNTIDLKKNLSKRMAKIEKKT